jgi:hypothetical protein
MNTKSLGLIYTNNYISVDEKIYLLEQIENFRKNNPKLIECDDQNGTDIFSVYNNKKSAYLW